MPIEKICKSCNKSFLVPKCRSSAQYCSMKCFPRNGADNKNWKGGLVECECKVCKLKFMRKKKDIVPNGNCCSRSCNAIANASARKEKHDARRVKKNCKVCEKEISVKPSHAKIAGTYCSKECMATDYKTLLIGEKNPNFRNGGICNTKDYKKEYNKKWKLKNPERKSELNRIGKHNYRAKKRENGGKLSSNLSKKLFSLQKGKCVCCGLPLGNDYHMDHIMPIKLGGENSDWNIQLLRSTCNRQKSAKHPIEFMQSKGFLL